MIARRVVQQRTRPPVDGSAGHRGHRLPVLSRCRPGTRATSPRWPTAIAPPGSRWCSAWARPIWVNSVPARSSRRPSPNCRRRFRRRRGGAQRRRHRGGGDGGTTAARVVRVSRAGGVQPPDVWRRTSSSTTWPGRGSPCTTGCGAGAGAARRLRRSSGVQRVVRGRGRLRVRGHRRAGVKALATGPDLASRMDVVTRADGVTVEGHQRRLQRQSGFDARRPAGLAWMARPDRGPAAAQLEPCSGDGGAR